MRQELALVQLGVQAADGEQLGMGALLDQAAVVEHQDLVGGQHGRQPMRDGDGGPPGERWLEGGLDELLGDGVQVGGGLVQQ